MLEMKVITGILRNRWEEKVISGISVDYSLTASSEFRIVPNHHLFGALTP